MTAFKFQQVCYNDPANPFLSWIMSTCLRHFVSRQLQLHGDANMKSAENKVRCRTHKVSNVVSSSVFSIHSLEHLQIVLWSGSAVDKEFANYGIGACNESMFKSVLIIIMYFHTEISLQCPFCHQKVHLLKC